MGNAIGMVEYKTVSSGIRAADAMTKAAAVEIIEAQTVCPGKYIILIKGDLSSINASVEAARGNFGEQLIDSFILGNPHDSIFGAIYGVTDIQNAEALGTLETYSAASIIVAADAAAKTAEVELIELRIARGMCGKSYLMLTGSVAAVTSAIEKAESEIKDTGMLLDSAVIPNPSRELWSTIID